MSCKEKYGFTPEEILNMNFGLRDGKSMTHLQMRKDAWREIEIKLHNESDKAMVVPGFKDLLNVCRIEHG